jgi:predicted NUDIX family phosphoesterase
MEFVLVVPRRDLFGERAPQGFLPFGSAAELADFERTVREQGFFVERERAERDPELKQIIPYTIVTRAASTPRVAAGATEELEVLLLKRLARGGEKRLHDKLSIGVGGHVEPIDAEPAAGASADGESAEFALAEGRSGREAVLERGTRRELDEELVLERELTWRRVGLLNDDSNPVGAVHLGLVQVARARGAVAIREAEVLSGDFAAPAALCEMLAGGANFETWSALLVARLTELIHEPEAALPHRLETSGTRA